MRISVCASADNIGKNEDSSETVLDYILDLKNVFPKPKMVQFTSIKNMFVIVIVSTGSTFIGTIVF